MASTSPVLREHGSSDDILATIPTKAQYGFKSIDVEVTCLDAEKTHLLFGTNIGAGFLFNRETRSNIKLLSESRNDIVTSVKLLIGIECQAALGTSDGKLTIVVFSHSSASSAKQVLKYNLGVIHQCPITCMCWSSNGMKLFSGDKGGNIYVSELDFEKNKCNASLLLTEQNGIVQLEYRHMILLVSTTERVLLYHANREENKVVSVGSKPTRRGHFGACFNNDTVSASDLRVLCTRPGHRIWVADVEGKVLSTLLMKDLVTSQHSSIKLLEDVEEDPASRTDNQFGKLMFYGDEHIVTYSDSSIFVINQDTHRILASNQNLCGILGVAMTTDEIFILKQGRKLHRIAEHPDKVEVKTFHATAEVKKKEGHSRHLQEVKESLSEMKKSFTPLVGALQSRMSNLNAGAEQLTSRLQNQAKVLQKKLPVVATSFFTHKESDVIPAPTADVATSQDSSLENLSTSSSSNEIHEEDRKSVDDITNYDVRKASNGDCDDEKVNNGKNCDVISECADGETSRDQSSVSLNSDENSPDLADKRSLSPENNGKSPLKNSEEFLHSQGDPKFRNDSSTKTSVDFHFEKLDMVVTEDDGEIVFNSKRKKKSRLGSNSRHSGDSGSPFHHLTKEENLTSDLHSSRLNIEGESSEVNDHQNPSETSENYGDASEDPGDEQTESASLVSTYIKAGKEDLTFGRTKDRDIGQIKTEKTSISEDQVPNEQSVCTSYDKEGHCDFTNSSPTSDMQLTTGTNHTVLTGNKKCNQAPQLKLFTSLSGDVVRCPGATATDAEANEDGVKGHCEELESEDLQETVVAVHKTTGNKLCPEILLSPTQSKKFTDRFNFSDSVSEKSLDLEEMGPSNSKGNSSSDPNLPDTKVPDCDDGLQSSTSKTSSLPSTFTYKSEKVDNSLFEMKHMPSPAVSVLEEAEISAHTFGETSDLGMPIPAYEEKHQVDQDQPQSFSSNPDDIYGVETAKRDFESELDSDSYDSDEELQYTHPQTNVGHKAPFSPTSSDLPFFSSSVPAKLLDSWSMTTTPHQVITISGSDNYIWYIDYYDHIYITEETGETVCDIKWRMFQKKGMQLAISPSGDFAWLVSRSGKVYASVLPPSLHILGEPLVLDWQLVGSSVLKVALGVDCAWAFSSSGGVKAQIGLSRAVPFTSGWEVIAFAKEKITHITLTKSAIWCRTDSNKLFTGNPASIYSQDFKWEEVESPLNRDGDPLSIQSITSDFGYVLWAVDNGGSLWFLTEDHKWWQVNISQYIDEHSHLVSPVFMQSLPSSFTTSVQRVHRWMTNLVRVQGVAVNNQSVWVVFEKQKIHIARGPLTGIRWDVTTPLGVAKSTRWQHITTSSVFSADHGTWIGLVWASQQNNEIFIFPSQEVATTHPVTLVPPVGENTSIQCMSACKEALWVLMDDGSIFIRSGISSDCLPGSQWDELDLIQQLGTTRMVHLSCGTQNVWAVDSTGKVFFRIGVTAVDRHSFPPAWIPIDGCPTPGSKFTQIECGLSDGSVWALDDFANVYVRLGVSFTMPVGSSWEVVPGSHAQQLCISNHTVWGLRVSGNLLRRFGISQKNQVGDYWKKMKGRFTKLAVTPYDELWAIDRDQHLRHQFTSIYCPPVAKAQYEISPHEAAVGLEWAEVRDEKDWEFV